MILPQVQICTNCRRHQQYHPGTCPVCQQSRPLGYPGHSDSALICAGCAGAPSVFACTQCGHEDHPYGSSRCARCILDERLTALLTDPDTGQVHEALRPVFDTILNSERPQTGIYWLARPPGTGPRLLARMARGEMPISHDTFANLPMDPGHNYLHELLTAVGVLPAYEPKIERILPWLKDLASTLTPAHGQMLTQFARWKVLRRLRQHAEHGVLTKGMVHRARNTLHASAQLMAWAEGQGLMLSELTQPTIEFYLDARPPSTASTLARFIRWANASGETSITVVSAAPPKAEVTMSDSERWDAVALLLGDTQLRPSLRIAGLFMLLFAQSITRICQIRTDQITITDDLVSVTFKDTPVQMPDPSPPSSATTSPIADRPPTPPATTAGYFPEGSPDVTSRPRTSEVSSSISASTRTPRNTPPCSLSPDRSRT